MDTGHLVRRTRPAVEAAASLNRATYERQKRRQDSSRGIMDARMDRLLRNMNENGKKQPRDWLTNHDALPQPRTATEPSIRRQNVIRVPPP
jgi:hypothetical protein